MLLNQIHRCVDIVFPELRQFIKQRCIGTLRLFLLPADEIRTYLCDRGMENVHENVLNLRRVRVT